MEEIAVQIKAKSKHLPCSGSDYVVFFSTLPMQYLCVFVYIYLHYVCIFSPLFHLSTPYFSLVSLIKGLKRLKDRIHLLFHIIICVVSCLETS